MKPFISIIIPVLNEAGSIVTFLKSLQDYRQRGHELILVDGGSHDETVQLASTYIDQSLVSIPGRAAQMNFGAHLARNEILLFLHSDTYLPESADTIIISSLSKNKTWGRFNLKLNGQQIIFRLIETMINLRSKFTKIATGDQAIFIKKNIFNQVNGYPNLALMEDIALSKKLRKYYRCACLTNKVTTSSRRWEKNGIVRTILLMWSLRFLYFFGVTQKKLHELYYTKNNSCCCLIFTKNPEPGKTKTRLIPFLGVNGAFDIHVKLFKHTLKLIKKTRQIDFQLHHTNSNTNKLLSSLIKKYKLRTRIQSGTNLGERMYNAMSISLNTYSHCIIIGTDCPELTHHYILQAKLYLSSGFDAVIGPAHDGGYVLIGLSKAHKELFTNITWGKNSVFKDTITKFKKFNLKYITLATLHDVDTQDDLQYLELIKN